MLDKIIKCQNILQQYWGQAGGENLSPIRLLLFLNDLVEFMSHGFLMAYLI